MLYCGVEAQSQYGAERPAPGRTLLALPADSGSGKLFWRVVPAYILSTLSICTSSKRRSGS